MTIAISSIVGLAIGFLFGRVGYLFWKTQADSRRWLGLFVFALAAALAVVSTRIVYIILGLALS